MHMGFVTADGICNLSPREARALCVRGAIILDVREEYFNEYKRFDVPTIIQIPLKYLLERYQELPTDKEIIVADSSGVKSKEVYAMLKEKAFTRLFNLAGGMVEWERDGMPLIINDLEKLTGSCACQLRARNRPKE